MLRNKEDAVTSSLALVLKWGGLGDQIARFTAIRYMLESFPQNRYHIFAPSYIIPLYERYLEQSGLKSSKVQVIPFSEWQKLENRNFWDYMIDFEGDRFTALRLHLVDCSWIFVNDRLPRNDDDRRYQKIEFYGQEVKSFREKFNLPSKFVVVTTLFTAPNRAWVSSEVNKTVQGLKKRGFEVVFLGAESMHVFDNVNIKAEDTGVDFSQGLDLRGKTTLLEAAWIIEQSQGIMGVDNGLLHLASSVNVPLIVWGFTNVEPVARIPVTPYKVKHGIVEPPKSLGCRFCQTNVNWVTHDFRECIYKDYKCLKDMKAERFLKVFDELREGK